MASTKLCNQCQRLALDGDIIFDSGVVEDTNTAWFNGSPTLRYKPVAGGPNYGMHTVFLSDRCSNSRPIEFMHSIPLLYQRFDFLPELPDLAKSSGEGCSFREVLREAILQRGTLEEHPEFTSGNC